MQGFIYWCFALLATAQLSSIIAAGTVNKEVLRTIDASTSIVKITTEIKITGALKEYIYVVPTEDAKHIAYIGGKAKGIKEPLDISPPSSKRNGNYTEYRIKLKDANPTIKIVTVLTEYLEAYPAEIFQNDRQLVKLVNSHYYYSLYPTGAQKTVFKLASSAVESYTRKVPHTSRGSTISLGPYLDVEPEAYSRCVVHYENHAAFAKLKAVQTDIEVSHWGSISVEEVIELEHAGARLKGGFSRFDYQMRRTEDSHSFRSLLAVLPGDASSIFYRDQIGNISSSELRQLDGEIELEIQPRFPMFGGWKSQFYLGYRVPTESMLTIDPVTGRYNFKFDFYTMFEDVWVSDLEVKVVLPEGCTDIKVDLPSSATSSWTRRFTYLDSKLNGGRPVLILRGKNLVAERDSEVLVSYSFSSSRIFVEPFMLCATFFSLFCLCSFIARTSSVPKVETVPVAEKKTKAE